MKHTKNNNKGIGFVVILLSVAFLTLVAVVVISFIESGQIIRRDVIVKQQSKYLANSGLEYALFLLVNNDIPKQITKKFGGGSFKITYDGYTGKITSTGRDTTMQEEASTSYIIKGPILSDFEECVVVDIPKQVKLEAIDKLQNITINNRCDIGIEVEAFRFGCNINKGKKKGKIKSIVLDNSNIFYDVEGRMCDNKMSIPSFRIEPCGKRVLSMVEFIGPIDVVSFNVDVFLKM